MTRTKILASLYYAFTMICAVIQVHFGFHLGILHVLGASISLAPTLWLIGDAAKRGSQIPHVIQPAVLMNWSVVVPAYILWTRRFRGLVLLLAHGFASWALYLATFYGTLYLAWGQNAFR